MFLTSNDFTANFDVQVNKNSNGLIGEVHGINEYNDIIFDISNISNISNQEYNLFTALAEAEEDDEAEDYSYRFIVLVDNEVKYISLLYDKNSGVIPVYADISNYTNINNGKQLILRVIKQHCRRNILPYKPETKLSRVYWRNLELSSVPENKLPLKHTPSQWLNLVNQLEPKPRMFSSIDSDESSETKCEVLEYSAKCYSGGKKYTAEIQALFEKAAAHKVPLRFPAGEYHFGRINLIGLSGINMIVEKDAYIRASEDYKDYGDDGWCNGFFYIRDCTDINISGEGVIDGMDCFDPNGEEGFRGAHLFNYTNCENINVSGLTFKNSGNYTNAVFNCKNVRYSNIKVIGGHNAVQYQDSENIYIGNCIFITGDDCIAGAEGRNVLVENCELNTSCNGFRLGGSDVTIRNVHIYGPGKYEHKSQKRNNTLSGFTYFAPADWGSTVYGDNWNISNVTVENADRFFIFDNIDNIGGWQDGMPLRNIVFNNVKATGMTGSTIFKGAPNNKIRIEMHNVSLTYKNTEGLAPFDLANVDEFIQDNLTINV